MVLARAGTHGNTGGPMDWFNQLPKVTRGYAALCVFTAACVSWGVPAVAYVFLDWSAVWHQWQVRCSARPQALQACSIRSKIALNPPRACTPRLHQHALTLKHVPDGTTRPHVGLAPRHALGRHR